MQQTPYKILLAGPWVGEFGWELFCWQGFIRKLSKKYDKTIVIGRPTNEYLYKDFCDEYIKFDPESFNTDAWNCHNAKNANHVIKTIKHTDYISGHFDIGMRYTQNGVIDTKGWFFNKQLYHKYETITKEDGYDVIFHCRNKKTGGERNWEKTQWEELYRLLDDDIKIACVGNNESFYIDGTKDLRNIDLNDLITTMNNSKLIVGPSSGPMHLASLCGLKHLVWSTEYNRVRYEKDWNPFNTETIIYSEEGWNPNPNNIKEIIKKEIDESITDRI